MDNPFDKTRKSEQDKSKKPYSPPQVDVMDVNLGDIVTTSNPDPWYDYGDWDVNDPNYHP